MATTSPYLMSFETGIMLIFLSIVMFTFFMFVLYVIWPTKEDKEIFK